MGIPGDVQCIVSPRGRLSECTVLALTNSETLTCFVSAPDFQFSIFVFLLEMFGKAGGDISRKNNNGVLDRPWTKWMVLMAISSTLKFQFTENHES